MNYNELVLQLFFNPEHAGINEQNQDYRVSRYIDASQTQQIEFYVVLPATGTFCSVRYKVKGNPYMIAGAEWMAQMVEKKQNDAILKDMTPQYWLDLFAIPKLDRQIAVSLSQAANVLYQLTQSNSN